MDRQFDLPQFVPDRLADARRALRETERGALPPQLKAQLVDVYTAAVDYLAALISDPLPTDLAGRLSVVRRVCGADGAGGVLDVTGVGNAAEYGSARVLSPGELTAALGTPRPTAADVSTHGRRLPDPGRGGCVCFPLFDSSGQQAGWQFVGCEVD